MNNNTSNEENKIQNTEKRAWNVPELIEKVRASRKLILRICGIGAIVGIVICLGIPKEYTANTLIAPESIRRSSSSSIRALTNRMGLNLPSSTDRDAILPSMYPAIIKSTPFLIQLFDIEVREQKDSTAIPLAQYLKERQKTPWWGVITSAPSRLLGLVTSLFSLSDDKPKVKKKNRKIDPFQLTREEAGIVSAIASKIKIGVDKKKRTITIFVAMQNPLVAATVADTVSAHLQAYITEYRTSKARIILKYNEKLCEEAKAKYYKSQEKQAAYADANQHLVMRTSRAQLTYLRNETNLALAAYNRIEQQVLLAKARVKEETPVYVVIQPAIVPLTPSKPQKIQILAIYILLSGAATMGWVLFGKDFLRKIRNKKRQLPCKQRKADD